MSIEEKIKEQIKENKILLYMKGSPYEPKCGFSAKTVQALIDCGAELRNLLAEAEDILAAHGPKEQRGVLIRDVRKNEDVLSKARAARAPKAPTLRVLASYARLRQAEEELREALKVWSPKQKILRLGGNG